MSNVATGNTNGAQNNAKQGQQKRKRERGRGAEAAPHTVWQQQRVINKFLQLILAVGCHIALLLMVAATMATATTVATPLSLSLPPPLFPLE